MEFTPQMLQEWWPRKILQMQEIRTQIGSRADDLGHLIHLCAYIIRSGMDSYLFPGAAPGKLRITRVENGKLPYVPTLEVSAGKTARTVMLRFEAGFAKDAKPSGWEKEISGSELISEWEKFVSHDTNWKNRIS